MPVNLKPTDVVVVGLGAAGGVAVLPLTQAGIEVIGLEAGTWLRPDDFAPDDLRNNFRGWPQAVQKANREIPTHRALAGILGTDPRATNAALRRLWNGKLDQIAHASSNVHGLLGGSILGEELAVLAMLAERAGMPVERPPGPRYWW